MKPISTGSRARSFGIPSSATTTRNCPTISTTRNTFQSRTRESSISASLWSWISLVSSYPTSTSQMGRFETAWLTRPQNLAALIDLPGRWIDKVHARRPPKIIVLDMDSSESPTYGEQEGSAYNGHFGCTCYHSLFVFNQFGDVERCALRPGNVHSDQDWREGR